MKQKSFTLIELLVVIAVIGLISSIILVSLKGTTKKARIAKTLEFSHTVNHVLGAYAVGIWSFDEGSGNAANDGSGYGNNGTIYGASWTDDTPHKVVGAGAGKYALSFDGVDDYVEVPDNSVFNFGTGDFTIEVWAKPNALAGDYRALVTEDLDRRDLCLILNNGGLSAKMYLDVDYVTQLSPALSWSLGQWYHLVATRKNGVTKMFRDGQEVSSATNQTGSVDASSGFYIGRFRIVSWHPWNGLIDEVRIYSEALSAAEIQKHYVEGLERHKNLAIK